MSVEFESKNRIANLISAANTKTGGSDTDLTSAVGSLMAGYGTGDGSMENGEITTTSYYKWTIPVSSKKTHLVVFPKEIGNTMAEHATGGRTYGLIAVEGNGHIQISLNNNMSSGMVQGSSYWYDTSEENAGYTEFKENLIEVNISYAPADLWTYNWFAW